MTAVYADAVFKVVTQRAALGITAAGADGGCGAGGIGIIVTQCLAQHKAAVGAEQRIVAVGIFICVIRDLQHFCVGKVTKGAGVCYFAFGFAGGFLGDFGCEGVVAALCLGGRFRGRIGGSFGIVRAGAEGKGHNQGKQCGDQSFHRYIPFLFAEYVNFTLNIGICQVITDNSRCLYGFLNFR